MGGEGLWVADLHLVDCYSPLRGMNRHHKLRCTCNRTCFISPRLHLISIRHFHSAEIKEIMLLTSWGSSPTLRETGLRAKLIFAGPPGRDPSWDIQVLSAEALTSQILCPSVGRLSPAPSTWIHCMAMGGRARTYLGQEPQH